RLDSRRARPLRELRPVITLTCPPTWYWYQTGTLIGPRSSPADTLSTPTCSPARNCSRSSTLMASDITPSSTPAPPRYPDSRRPRRDGIRQMVWHGRRHRADDTVGHGRGAGRPRSVLGRPRHALPAPA